MICTYSEGYGVYEPTHCGHTQWFPATRLAHEYVFERKEGGTYILGHSLHGWAKPRRPKWAGKKSTLTSFTVPNYKLHEA